MNDLIVMIGMKHLRDPPRKLRFVVLLFIETD